MLLGCFASDVVNLLFPPSCLHCNYPLKNKKSSLNNKYLCTICCSELEKEESVWSIKNLDHGIRIARYPYNSFYQKLIVKAKYEPNVELLKLLARKTALAFKHYPAIDWDMIIPIPPTEINARKRLFNQCLVVANELNKELGKTANVSNLLVKDSRLKPQTGSTLKTRKENANRGLSLKESNLILGRKILIVDDVVTTGSTLKEASQLLQGAGASRLDQIVLAEA
jgi:ComF family protein